MFDNYQSIGEFDVAGDWIPFDVGGMTRTINDDGYCYLDQTASVAYGIWSPTLTNDHRVFEMRNLIASSEHASIRDRMHDRLLDWMNDTRDPFRGYCWERRPWRASRRRGWRGQWRPYPSDGYAPPVRDYRTGQPNTGARATDSGHPGPADSIAPDTASPDGARRILDGLGERECLGSHRCADTHSVGHLQQVVTEAKQEIASLRLIVLVQSSLYPKSYNRKSGYQGR
jgi:hypothetical protein